ncbi:MAG: glutaredoxin family protein [bacterium]
MISSPRFQEFSGNGSPQDITVYGLLQCVPCKEAKEFLQGTGVAFRYVILEQQKPEVRQELKRTFQDRLGKRPVYPVLEIKGELTFGFHLPTWRAVLAQIEGAE